MNFETLSRDELVAAYKVLLRHVIDRNPSGLRLKLSNELNTHKSFISQISNPVDPTPIPAKHLALLFRLCHFSADEQRIFLNYYRQAHPNRAPKSVDQSPGGVRYKTIKVEVPVLKDKKKQRALEQYVSNLARNLRDIL